MAKTRLSWAVPVMRVGYAGRGLVYVVIAGFSLYAIWRGGQAQGTSSALKDLETTTWGGWVLVLIFIGMLAYAAWSVIDAIFDLEECGSEVRGVVARLGMAVTGVIHLSIGILALSILVSFGAGGEGSSIERWVATLMRFPGGRLITAAIGIAAFGAGFVYVIGGWKEEYRDHIAANPFTENWNALLKTGVMAHGLINCIIGALFVFAAWRANPKQAGGVGDAFSWVTNQPYGQTLVALLCVALLAFAMFCFVNAAYRVIPATTGGNIETVAERLKSRIGRQA